MALINIVIHNLEYKNQLILCLYILIKRTVLFHNFIIISSKVVIINTHKEIIHLNNNYHLVKICYNKEIQVLIFMLNVLIQQMNSTQ